MENPGDENVVFKQRAVIEFLVQEGVKKSEILQRLTAVYGTSALHKTQVYEWANRFKAGQTGMKDEERSGRPVTSSSKSVIERVEEVVFTDRRLTCAQIAEASGISKTTAHDILTNRLGMHKVSCRWVPRNLQLEQRRERQQICEQLLQRYRREGEPFLRRIVTVDETWVHHYDPTSKQQSSQWKHTDSPPPKKFRVCKSAGKVMLICFWDCKGVILNHFVPHGQTVTGSYYREVLVSQLALAIKEKRRGMTSHGILFLQDNAPPHRAQETIAAIRSLGWEILPHPAYSPDLAPSDYFLFPELKKHIKGKQYQSDKAVKCAVSTWFSERPEDWFRSGIEKLPKRWTKCLRVAGSYVEK